MDDDKVSWQMDRKKSCDIAKALALGFEQAGQLEDSSKAMSAAVGCFIVAVTICEYELFHKNMIDECRTGSDLSDLAESMLVEHMRHTSKQHLEVSEGWDAGEDWEERFYS